MNDAMSTATWRMLVTEPASGVWNMAVDEAIATQARQGHGLTTLRFYRWQPPCVSLGRHQPMADIDRERCLARGYDVVRRPTGGRAILHIDELTYSVAGTQDDPLLSGAVLDCYLRLSQGLVAGLAHLGLAVAKAPAMSRSGSGAGPVCFEVPSAYEIVAGGKKLVGSAQSRRQGWVLQHGTLPLVGDVTRLVDVLALPDEAQRPGLRQDLAGRATTVAQVLGREVSFDRAVRAMADGFAEALGVRLEPGVLSPAEVDLADRLAGEVYASEAWLKKF
jgi:lipoate-protein ligase A